METKFLSIIITIFIIILIEMILGFTTVDWLRDGFKYRVLILGGIIFKDDY